MNSDVRLLILSGKKASLHPLIHLCLFRMPCCGQDWSSPAPWIEPCLQYGCRGLWLCRYLCPQQPLALLFCPFPLSILSAVSFVSQHSARVPLPSVPNSASDGRNEHGFLCSSGGGGQRSPPPMWTEPMFLNKGNTRGDSLGGKALGSL